MEENKRVIAISRYNYYKYYNARKEYYKMNYLERKRREAIEAEHKDYYKDYWNLSLWKEENMREYKKNNI
jgi:hypothetical protein